MRTACLAALVLTLVVGLVCGMADIPPEPESPEFRSGDVNCDGVTDISDAVFLLLHLFRRGEAPCPVGTSCGEEFARLNEELSATQEENNLLQDLLDEAISDIRQLGRQIGTLRTQLDEARAREAELEGQLVAATLRIEELESKLYDSACDIVDERDEAEYYWATCRIAYEACVTDEGLPETSFCAETLQRCANRHRCSVDDDDGDEEEESRRQCRMTYDACVNDRELPRTSRCARALAFCGPVGCFGCEDCGE